MLDKVAKTIKKYNMLRHGDSVVVAVSGGPDSVALLHSLNALKDAFDINLAIAYINHGLRGDESKKEEAFVRSLSVSLSIPLEFKSIDVKALKKEGIKRTLEEIGREERYRFFLDVAKNRNAQRIALGHHFHDQAETVLLNLLRGSGIEGLKGFLPVRDDKIIRPLMECTRKEILTFIGENGLEYIQDSTNNKNIYTRNKIRNQLIPEIQRRFNPGIEKTLNQTAEILRHENDFLAACTYEALMEMHIDFNKDKIEIDRPKFLSFHEAIQRRVIKELLLKYTTARSGIAFVHIESVKNFIEKEEGHGTLDLPFGIEVVRSAGMILFHVNPRQGRSRPRDSFEYPEIEAPSRINIKEVGRQVRIEYLKNLVPSEELGKDANLAYIDYEALVPPLSIRNLRPGDRIQPLGMKGTQKIKSFFIDHKIPKSDRSKIPLLVDQLSVIWIAGMRISERVKITDKTQKIVIAEIV